MKFEINYKNNIINLIAFTYVILCGNEIQRNLRRFQSIAFYLNVKGKSQDVYGNLTKC